MKKLLIVLMILTVIFSFSVMASAEGADEPSADELPTMGAQFVSFCSEHLSEILTAVTTAFTGVMLFAFKKGLLPTLTKGLRNVTGAVQTGLDTANATVDSMKTANDENIREIAGKLSPILEQTKKALDATNSAASRLSALEENLEADKTDREMVCTLLKMQSDIIYNFLMAANAPAYLKEKVSEYYSKAQSVVGSMSETPAVLPKAVVEDV